MNDHLFSFNRDTRIAPFLVYILKLRMPSFLCFEEAFLAGLAKLIFVIPVILAVAEKHRGERQEQQIGPDENLVWKPEVTKDSSCKS